MNQTEILTHLGEEREKYFNAVAPPIIQTSNFKFDTIADLKKRFGNAVLEQKEASNVKGGLRYETTSNVEFVNKVTALAGQGECVCWAYHDGVYCIEW